MLILTRRIGETLMVGDEVTVTVLGVKGNQVRLGVNAPKEVAVHRAEVYHRIQNGELPPELPTPELTTNAANDSELKTGTVSYIQDEKGFGFIYSPGVADNLYFHSSSLIGVEIRNLDEGIDVSFKVGSNHRGPIAEEVRLA